MSPTKDQVTRILALALAFLIGLLAVFGYDVGVIQPRERTAIEQAVPAYGTGGLDAQPCRWAEPP